MNYQCVIFDMDGTLIDSYEGIYHSYEWTMKKMGRVFGGEQFVRNAIGAPLPVTFRESCGMDEKEVQQAVQYYRDYYDRAGKHEAVLYEGMEKTLKQLKQAGCFLGVATMKKERFAEEILKSLDAWQYFDAVHGADEEGKFSKADLILQCLEDAEIKKEHAILVGDTRFDAEGAAEAGIDFLAVTYGFGFTGENPEGMHGAVYTAHTAAEIVKGVTNGRKKEA